MNELSSGSISARLQSLIEKIITPSGTIPDDSVLYWRERILMGFLLTAVIVGALIVVPAVVLQVRVGLWVLSVITILSLICAITILLYPRLSYVRRASVALFLSYVIGLGIMINVGVLSGGPAWLFAFAVLAGLFLGFRAAITALIINMVTLFVLGWLQTAGHCCQDQVFFESTSNALIAGISFLLMNTVTTAAGTILVRGLQAIARNEKATSEKLKQEQTRLLAAQQELSQEVEAHLKTGSTLKESEEKYRLLTESITDVIWTTDLSLNYTYVSPAAEKLQGWRVEEFLKMNAKDMLTAESFEIASNVLSEELIVSEKSNDFNRSNTLEMELYRKDGSTLWTEVTASFLLDENGEPVGLLGVTRDITERRKSEKERSELQQKLERLKKMEALGLLAGGVAHDLNNVLSGIISYPELLLMDLPKDSPLIQPIQTMKTSGEKAAAIVQDLLTLARRGVNTTEVLNLNAIIMEYLTSPEHDKLISFHPGVKVETRLEEKLPNLVGSSVHLRKTIMNLISNAAEAQPGGGRIIISTCSRYVDTDMQGFEKVAEGEYVVLNVEDHGEGIAAEDLQRIFEPFYTKKIMGRSGTGLGMAVVWGTVQDHKGYIDVESEEGQGTRFELYFPMTRRQIRQDVESPPIADFSGNRESILVVDDVREQREIATTILEKLNYRVSTAASGEEAIHYVKTNPVDLLILDMIMEPGIDGLETYRQILDIQPGQKAIIASGFSETDRVREAQRLGAGSYTKKPYSMESIARAVKEEIVKKIN